MEPQSLVNFGLSAVMAVLGWFARELWAAVKELKLDLAKLREDIPKDYLGKNDYRQDLVRIELMLNRILDKLDLKADKT